MRAFRKFTSAVPLKERTVVLTDGKRGFANLVSEKIAMAKAAKSRDLYVAWPGSYDTHVFKVTGKEVLAQLAPPPQAFKVGDLVRVKAERMGQPPVGTVGVVRCIGGADVYVGVEFPRPFRGHSLMGRLVGTRAFSGWNLPVECLEPA